MADRVDVVAIIPARGGSEGVPRKNLAPVGGIPLVVRAVRAAMQARGIDLVVVSTDDDEIGSVAAAEGAVIVHRPPELATGTASSESAVLHALKVLERDGVAPSVAVLIQCTSPFTTADDIDGCVDRLSTADAGCALTVSPSHRFLWRAGAGGLVGVNHDATLPRTRRQDLAPEYVETGAVYALDTEMLKAHRHRFGSGAVPHVIDAARSIEIDSYADLEMARRLAPVCSEASWSSLPDPVDLLVLDFDGVLTDNTVLIDETGTESIRANRGDGLGLEMLRSRGVPVVVLSKEINPVVAARCRKLRIEAQQAVDDKPPALRRLVDRHGARLEHTIFVGNDVNDVACLEMVGCGVVVADAHAEAMRVADIVLTLPGGHGAVRELIDAILRKEP